MTDRRWLITAALLLVVAALVTGCSIGATPTPDVPQTPMVVPGGTPGAQATRISVPAADPQIALDSIEYREGAILARVNGREITWEDFEPSYARRLSASPPKTRSSGMIRPCNSGSDMSRMRSFN